ncbi:MULTISPECIES: response regulator receiver protein [unclassified Roseitalea]|uniref:AAA family ATPase n=1 Tax=unclassified Roseitalea TaxID=2639107 RepID=UPI00273F5C19|nr:MULTISPECIES: response regulator receiver protein [unclassified Roseitalea]
MTDKTSTHSIVLISPDRHFVAETRSAFFALDHIALETIEKPLMEMPAGAAAQEAGVVIVDLDDAPMEALEALGRLKRQLGARVPIVVAVREVDPGLARILVQMQIADLLTKPTKTADLVRSCMRALKGMASEAGDEAEIFAFMPAAGGVGNTILALQTAFILHNSATGPASTCVVDLNFQFGSCAEYLDIEPAFKVAEIGASVERLDRQLLDALLSRHNSGLAVLAAPNDPAEQSTFDPDVVTRVLDLVSAYFNHVVIDMPRIWFPWTETVLRGANHVFLTAELTVPCMRHTQRLLKAIDIQTESTVKPGVIINRCDPRAREPGIRDSDVRDLLGDKLAGCISNNYRLVRSAVDRGVPIHDIDPDANVLRDLRRVIQPQEAALEARRGGRGLFGLSALPFRRAG